MDAEVLATVLGEAREKLDALDSDFLVMCEQEESDCFARMRRDFHSIKGSSAFLELEELRSLARAGEMLLTSLRDGQVSLDDDMTTAIFEALEGVRELVARVADTGSDAGGPGRAELITTLYGLAGVEPE